MDSLTPAEQQQVQKIVEEKQMQSFMKVYSDLIDTCFHACVNDFTSKSLQDKEEGCITRCVKKTFKANERVGQRFAEINIEQSQQRQ